MSRTTVSRTYSLLFWSGTIIGLAGVIVIFFGVVSGMYTAEQISQLPVFLQSSSMVMGGITAMVLGALLLRGATQELDQRLSETD